MVPSAGVQRITVGQALRLPAHSRPARSRRRPVVAWRPRCRDPVDRPCGAVLAPVVPALELERLVPPPFERASSLPLSALSCWASLTREPGRVTPTSAVTGALAAAAPRLTTLAGGSPSWWAAPVVAD